MIQRLVPAPVDWAGPGRTVREVRQDMLKVIAGGHLQQQNVSKPFLMCFLTECPPGRYGVNCQLDCRCQNNGTCDRVTGGCQCTGGFYGHSCEHGKTHIGKGSVKIKG